MKPAADVRSYKLSAILALALGVPISLLGTVLLAVPLAVGTPSDSGIGEIVLKSGVVMVLFGYIMALAAAFKARRVLSRGLRTTVIVLLVISIPFVIGLTALLFKL